MRNPKDTDNDRREGRKCCTTWIEPDLWRALRVAGINNQMPTYTIVEEALRKHPLVKKELNDGR